VYWVLQINMAALIKAGKTAYNEWVLGKMGKYGDNLKTKNYTTLCQHGATAQNKNIGTSTALRTSNLT
jgi:hypothetical protein